MVNSAHKYDAALNFDRNVTQAEYERIAKIESVSGVQYEMITNAKVYSGSKQETVRVTVTEDAVDLKLFDYYGEGTAFLPSDGVFLGRETADKLEVGIGDTVTVKFTDNRLYYQMPIKGISADTDGVIAGRSYWRGLSRGFRPTSAYVAAADVAYLHDRVSGYDFVSSFNTKKTVTDTVITAIESLVMVVYILILFGGALALVVLLNLGIMSFYEQIRNLATLKVLGFHDIEARKLLLTENIVFSVMGVIAGIPLGLALAHVLITSYGTVTFELHPSPLAYVISSALTMLFTVAVNIIIGRKMRDIEMLGALKSVE